MPVIRLAGFAGENRALHPMLLPDSVGVTSRNQKPGRGDFRPWKQPSTVAAVPAGRQRQQLLAVVVWRGSRRARL
jgi:hypothetical protein